MKKLLVILMMMGVGNLVHARPIFVNQPQAQQPLAGGLIELYKGLDGETLRSKDESVVARYLQTVTPEIVDYVRKAYGEDLEELTGGNPANIFFYGFLIAHYEASAIAGKMGPEPGGDLEDCLKQAVSAITGITLVVQTYHEMLQAGANFTTVMNFLKKFIKNKLSWFTAAWAIYEFGGCMKWW